MMVPLIPFDMYEAFEGIGNLPETEKVPKIKELLGQLKKLNFNTLKFHIDFFREVTTHHEAN